MSYMGTVLLGRARRKDDANPMKTKKCPLLHIEIIDTMKLG